MRNFELHRRGGSLLMTLMLLDLYRVISMWFLIRAMNLSLRKLSFSCPLYSDFNYSWQRGIIQRGLSEQCITEIIPFKSGSFFHSRCIRYHGILCVPTDAFNTSNDTFACATVYRLGTKARPNILDTASQIQRLLAASKLLNVYLLILTATAQDLLFRPEFESSTCFY